MSVALPPAAEEVVRSGAPALRERVRTAQRPKAEAAGQGLRVVVLVPAYTRPVPSGLPWMG